MARTHGEGKACKTKRTGTHDQMRKKKKKNAKYIYTRKRKGEKEYNLATRRKTQNQIDTLPIKNKHVTKPIHVQSAHYSITYCMCKGANVVDWFLSFSKKKRYIIRKRKKRSRSCTLNKAQTEGVCQKPAQRQQPACTSTAAEMYKGQ
ncbi:hypothetical protein SESBI_09991 [Sesbania bispinosa]|nr:hypothetical protein SESBI_09991 [Sesbania bispinosa]